MPVSSNYRLGHLEDVKVQSLQERERELLVAPWYLEAVAHGLPIGVKQTPLQAPSPWRATPSFWKDHHV